MRISKNHYFLLLCCFIFPTFLNAQPPGYLGNRLFATFNLSSSPTLQGPSQNNNGTEYFGTNNDRSWGIDYEYEAKLSYVVGRYASIGIGVGDYYTGMITRGETESLGQDQLNFFETLYDRHDLFYRLNVKSASIFYHKYRRRKGSLAPLGSHFLFGLKRSFVTGKILDKKTRLGFPEIGEIYGHSNLNIDEQVAYNSIMLGWANNQILWNRLILKVGFRFVYPISIDAFVGWRDSDESHDDFNTNPNQALFENNAYGRIVRHEMIRMDLGIGILIF